jgi:hypothetical protein
VSESSTPDYVDGDVQLSVDTATDHRPIRLRAAGIGVGCVVDLTALGAQRLSAMLDSAVTSAITRGMPTEETDL